MFYKYPVCLYTLGNWSSCEISTIVDCMRKSVDYAIQINCKEAIQHKLKIVVSVLKIFVTLTLEVSSVPIVTMIIVINGKILTLE